MASTGTRYNINSTDLSQAERQRYFWCLKMLVILPPFATQDKVFKTPGYNQPPDITNIIKPKCLYDYLIASYYSSKQGLGPNDQTYFYGLYHRHLVIYFEYLLNYADQMLQLDLETFNNTFPGLVNQGGQTYLQNILQQYKDLGLTSKVMAHYWNPTNYKSSKDLEMPPQLADKNLYNGDYDDMDNFFFVVRGHYPFEVSARTRWHQYKDQITPTNITFKNKYLLNVKTKLIKDQYIYPTAYAYTGEEIAILNRTMIPRPGLTQFNNYYEYFTQLCDFTIPAIIPNTFKQSLTLSNVKLNTANIVNVYSLGQRQLNTNFAYQSETASSNNGDDRLNSLTYSYFSQDEIAVLFGSTGSVQSPQMRNLRDYNDSLVYYQMAYGLYNYKVHEFMRFLSPKNGQPFNSNSEYEDDLHYLGVDGPYSVYNLLFFPYHSFVDAQMQLSIRLNNSPTNVAETINYLFLNYLTNRPINEYYDWNATGSRNNVVVSPVQQYLINTDMASYRTSTQMEEIYSTLDYNLVQKLPKNDLLKFAGYNANYQYDFLVGAGKKIDNMPKDLKYIEDMRADVQSYSFLVNKIVNKVILSSSQLDFANDLLQKGYLFTLTTGKIIRSVSLLGTIALDFHTDLLIERFISSSLPLSQEQIAIIKGQDFKKQINIYASISQFNNYLTPDTRHKKQSTNVYWTKTRKVTQIKQIFNSDSQILNIDKDVLQLNPLKVQQDSEKSSHFINVKGAEKVFFSITYRTPDQQINDFLIEIEGISNKNTGQVHRRIIQSIRGEDLIQKQGGEWQFEARELFENLAIAGLQPKSSLDRYTYTNIAVGIAIKNNRQHFRRQIVQHYSEISYSLEIAQNGNGFSAVAKETTNSALRVQEVKQEY